MSEFSRGWQGREVVVLSPTPSHPQNYGNRKRVHAVCRRLQAAGARIHFVHYASEVEWRDRYPLDAVRAMTAAWESYTQVVPTRPLHPAPMNGRDHAPDEWWDPAIADMLRWLFARLDPDVFLVNYTWLSQALELAPTRALRVLDTHDRFSGRRDLLEANAIAPEFFHLDEEGEALALSRADLVWAIKEQEEGFFRTLVDRPVVTLPHADPWQPIEPAPDPTCLRLGIVGARNSLNVSNITAFLEVALPIFTAHLAPLKIRIAGSVCEDLGHLRTRPFVDLAGRFEDMVDFYRTVDAALVPMAFSTGLKIKVGEALALGMPVLAHAHAFEGYRVHDPTQDIPTFEALARACVDLAYAPERMATLREAAAATQRTTEAAVEAGLDATLRQLERHRPSILLLTGTGPLAAPWLSGNVHFYHALGEVRVARIGGIRAGGVHGAPDLPLPPQHMQVLAADDRAGLQRLVDMAEFVVVADVPETSIVGIDWRGVDVHLVAGLAAFDRPSGTLDDIARHLRVARSFVLLTAERLSLAQARAAGLAHAAVPVALFGGRSPPALQPSSPQASSGRDGLRQLLILAPMRERGRGRRLLAGLRQALPWAPVKLVCRIPGSPPRDGGEVGSGEIALATAVDWLIGEGRCAEVIALDLEPDALAHAALREVLLRQGRVVVPAPAGQGFAPLATAMHLLRADLGQGGEAASPPDFRDCGFAWLWRRFMMRKRSGFAADEGSEEAGARLGA